MSKRDFLTLADIDAPGWSAVWRRAAQLKAERAAGKRHTTLAGKSVALVFEKASTRTRVSFEVGVFELGGHAVVLNAQGSQIARGEPIEDTARVLSGYCHAIMLRTFGQERVAALAKSSSVPVINGLSDQHHPCQIASDLFTTQERFGGAIGDLDKLRELRFSWIGDGNNMAHSWIEAAGLFGLQLVLACPDGYGPDSGIVSAARTRQVRTGGSLELTTDPVVAARGAHVLSTDVWASMGQEDESAVRAAKFNGYQIDRVLLQHAAANAITLHCLPAHRGEEICSDVIDAADSAIWQQAENRLHVQKAILEALLPESVLP